MIYIDGDYLEFAEKHKIDPVEMKCPTCDITLTTSVPFRIKGYAGLELPAHGCKNLAAVLVPINEEETEFWKQFIKAQ